MKAHLLPFLTLIGLITGPGAGAGAEQVPADASGWVERLTTVYRDLAEYSDVGAYEIYRRGEAPRRWHTRTWKRGTELRWSLWEEASGRLEAELWRQGPREWLVRPRRRAYGSIPSLLAAATVLMGEGSEDALLVLALLAAPGTPPSPFDAPLAAAVDDEAGGVVLTLGAGAGVTRAWIDPPTGWIRRIEVERPSPEDVIARALQQGGGSGDPALRLVVTHHPSPPPARAPALVRLADMRRETDWRQLSADPPPSPTGSGPPRDTFADTVSVELLSLVVRALGPDHRPLPGLAPEDFVVEVGGVEATVAGVDWVEGPTHAPPPAGAVSATGRRAKPSLDPPPLVFFVQAARHAEAIKGQLRLLPLAEDLLAGVDPRTRTAVLSFDSQLRLRQDFTTDRDRILEALARGIRFGGASRNRGRTEPSLARLLEAREARAAATPEEALLVTARTLGRLPGDKTLVFIGWGLGAVGDGPALNAARARPALQALGASRTTVFVLDATQADYHGLEDGLRSLAGQTGGTYAATYLFPDHAVRHLAAALTGHYVLTVDTASLPAVGGRVRIRLRQHRGRVLTPPLSLPR